jgi:dihydroorotase
MQSSTLTVRGGTLALGGGLVQGDLQITSGRITAVGVVRDDLGEVIDARHLLVMPGVIDPQVHFREPGFEHKEDIGSGSRAAAAGGVTAFLEMPNTRPPTISAEALAWKVARARQTSAVDFGFFIGATKDNVDAQSSVADVPGIKVFMGSSTGDLLVSERADLERIFSRGERLIAVHAEDEARLTERKRASTGRTDPAVHSEIRDAETARLATALAIELSERYGRRLHILHMSTKDEVELLDQRGKGGGRITCEVTPQHLLLHAPDAYARLGTRAQMNPPLRSKEHTDALWSALKRGLVDCIATDHAPHTLEEKSAAYPGSPSGMPGVETALPLMLDAAARGLCTVDDVVRWMCEGPARCYGILGKGRIEIGYDGDLALVDLARTERVGARGYFTRVGWSPFDGVELRGWPVMTIVRGGIVFREGQIATAIDGRPVRFAFGER